MPGETIDALISYSRKDQKFVRLLTAALATHDLDIWVDWEGIPLSSKWLAEIERAIEAANAFIFVISPDSLSSEICRAEIRHAAEQCKKFIPVICRDVNPDEAPPELAKWQWLLIRPEDDFDVACTELIEALRTDLKHVRTHTRLLVQAREWEERGRSRSSVLRGKVLEQAQAWLGGIGDRQPPAANLHREYIAAGHRVRRLLLRLRAAAAGLFVVALGVGFLFFQIAAREALIARHEAYATTLNLAEEAHLANERDLAAARLSELIPAIGIEDLREFAWHYMWRLYNSHRAMIFVSGKTESIAISPDSKTLAIANGSELVTLWDLETGTFRRRIDDPDYDVTVAEFVQDGSRLATGGGEGTRLWAWADPPEDPPKSLGSSMDLIHASPDGETLLSIDFPLDQGQVVKLWQLGSGKSLQPKDSLVRGETAAFAFRRDGAEFALGYKRGGVRRLDTRNGAESWISLSGEPRITDLCYPGNDALVISLVEDGHHQLVVWDLEQDRERSRQPGPEAANSALVALRCDPSGSRVAMLVGSALIHSPGQDNRLVVWDVATGEHIYDIVETESGFITAIRFSHSGDRFATGSRDHGIRQWDAETGRQLSLVGFHHSAHTREVEGRNEHREAGMLLSVSEVADGGISHLGWSPDGKTLVTASRVHGTVMIWDADVPTDHLRLPQKADHVAAIAWAPDGSLIATGDRNGSVGLWETATYSKTSNKSLGSPVSGLAFARTGDSLAGVTGDGEVIRMSADTLEETGRLDGYQAASDPFGSRLVLTNDAAVVLSRRLLLGEGRAGARVWDLSQRRSPIDVNDGTVGVAVARDGSRLAAIDGCALRVWDLELWSEKTLLARPECREFLLQQVAVSPDGSIVAVGGSAGWRRDEKQTQGILLFDMSAGTHSVLEFAVGISSSDGIQALAFSPGGKSLVAVSALPDESGRVGLSHGALVTVWDVDQRRQIAALELPSSEICDGFRAASCVRLGDISPDGRTIAVVRGVRPPQLGRSEIVLWEWETDETIAVQSSHRIDHLIFSPDGEAFATLMTARDVGEPAIVWRRTGEPVAVLGNYAARIHALRQTPERLLAATHENTSASGRVSRVWDLTAGQMLLSRAEFGEDAVGPVAFAPDARRLAVGRENGALIWNLDEGRSVISIDVGKLPVESAVYPIGPIPTTTFSPDSSIVVTAVAGDERQVHLSNATTGAPAGELVGWPPVAFSPTGNMLAATYDCKTVRLWRFSEGTPRLRHELPPLATCPNGLQFSPDGANLLTLSPEGGPFFGNAPAQARLWEVGSSGTGVELQGYEPDRPGISAFAPDGKTLATAGIGGRVQLWDPSTGRLLMTLAGPEQPIVALEFSRSGSVLTAGHTAEVRHWRLAERRGEPHAINPKLSDH